MTTMDGSLRVDSRQPIQSSRNMHQDRTGSSHGNSGKLAHYYRSSPGVRPLSLDTASDIHLNTRRASTDSSPELSTKKYQVPQYAPPVGHQRIPEDMGTESRDVRRTEASGYTKPSTSPPNAQQVPGLDAIGRRRAQSIGSGPRGSRIAALSVQLRTRLSHAAARIEKKRQPQPQYQSPVGMLQKNSSAPILNVETLSRTGQPLPIADLEDQRLMEIGSPIGTTISAPDASETTSPHPLEAPLRHIVASSSDLYPPPQSDPQRYFERSSSEQPVRPGLAPPVEIAPSNVKGQRRRPNPNVPASSARYTPFPLHRRGRSQQEFQMDTEIDRVPETPPLISSTLNTSGSYNTLSENSQSSSMEQDAIETLLFMSSPGTSGYHSASQSSQRNQDFANIDSSMSQNVTRGAIVDDGLTSRRQPGSYGTRQPKTADEIDLLLDQMASDSDDDVSYTRPSRLESQSSVIGAGGNRVQQGA
ncbi:hypothetical protein BDV18DRAFT_41370 [Aspergillus unguis]